MTKYEIIKQEIKEQIKDNILKPNQVIKSENEMCQCYKVSRVTVRKAIDELCAEGILYRIKGKGCFVRELADQKRSRIYSFTEAVRNEGKLPGKKQLSLEKKEADAYLADQAAEIWKRAGALYGKEKRDASCDSGNKDSTKFWDSEKQAAKDCVRAEIPLATFRTQPDILKTYLIRHMLNLLHPGWKNITSRHFHQITELAEKQVGSRINLPGGLIAMIGYETLALTRNTGPDMVSRKTEAAGPGYGEEYSLEMDQALQMTVFSRQKGQEIPKNQYTKWFDYDKIKGTLSIRTRKTGDYLILPSGGRKTIARFMIDEKIPKEDRDHILLLAENDHVLWVVGYRISEYYKIDNKTKNILQVTCDGGKDYGR